MDVWEIWAQEVDNGMGHMNMEIGTLKALVDRNCGVVENLLDDTKIRVKNAMQDYKNEIHK